MGTFGTDHATDGHEETNGERKGQMGIAMGLRELYNIPEGGSGTQHVFTEGAHDTVGAGTILEDGDGS